MYTENKILLERYEKTYINGDICCVCGLEDLMLSIFPKLMYSD